MKSIISPEYAALNRQLHEEREDYGASGGKNAPYIVKMCNDNGLKVILDFGCGKGSLKRVIAKLDPSIEVLEFDPAIPGKDTLPSRDLDLVVALDVMEHIEPAYLEATLTTIRDLRPKAVYLIISLREAHKSLPDGRNAHLIVESAEKWSEHLGAYFKPVMQRAAADRFLYVGTPR